MSIVVSIACIAYNHEDYIGEAIESLLMQKTNFEFEILIHDDASTDRTPDIIKEYEKNYPNLIKPIYQSVNQYSKGKKVYDFNIERAKGKYLAICEGDDYWTDPFKLQKQVDFMEKSPEYSLCVHAGYIVNTSGEKLKMHVRPKLEDKEYTIDEVIEGGGGLFATNSMLCRTSFATDRPKFFEISSVEDYPLTINLALQGKVYYLDDFMSAYRVGDSASWTVRNFSTIEKRIKHYEEMAEMLDEINVYSNFKYEDVIVRTKNRNQFSLLLEQGKIKEAKEFKDLFLELRYRRKIIIYLNKYPRVSKILKKVKNKLNR